MDHVSSNIRAEAAISQAREMIDVSRRLETIASGRMVGKHPSPEEMMRVAGEMRQAAQRLRQSAEESRQRAEEISISASEKEMARARMLRTQLVSELMDALMRQERGDTSAEKKKPGTDGI
jgi:hypothetical protein